MRRYRDDSRSSPLERPQSFAWRRRQQCGESCVKRAFSRESRFEFLRLSLERGLDRDRCSISLDLNSTCQSLAPTASERNITSTPLDHLAQRERMLKFDSPNLGDLRVRT